MVGNYFSSKNIWISSQDIDGNVRDCVFFVIPIEDFGESVKCFMARFNLEVSSFTLKEIKDIDDCFVSFYFDRYDKKLLLDTDFFNAGDLGRFPDFGSMLKEMVGELRKGKGIVFSENVIRKIEGAGFDLMNDLLDEDEEFSSFFKNFKSLSLYGGLNDTLKGNVKGKKMKV